MAARQSDPPQKDKRNLRTRLNQTPTPLAASPFSRHPTPLPNSAEHSLALAQGVRCDCVCLDVLRARTSTSWNHLRVKRASLLLAPNHPIARHFAFLLPLPSFFLSPSAFGIPRGALHVKCAALVLRSFPLNESRVVNVARRLRGLTVHSRDARLRLLYITLQLSRIPSLPPYPNLALFALPCQQAPRLAHFVLCHRYSGAGREERRL
ncbi:hypothetical protein C8J57DRAFT_1507419 [Mycena rebaudengoi]|nr:hypothetical protein C8J57DRAFT_1507419 [Mycena rebaudengoi]